MRTRKALFYGTKYTYECGGRIVYALVNSVTSAYTGAMTPHMSKKFTTGEIVLIENHDLPKLQRIYASPCFSEKQNRKTWGFYYEK